jgi:hypothetical protein
MAKPPPSEATPKHKKFTVYLPEKTIYELKILAAKERTSCSALIDQCARKIIEQKGA